MSEPSLFERKMEELGAVLDHLAPHTVFKIGPVEITSSVVNTWIVMAILFISVFVMTRNLKERPKGAQAFLELVMLFFYGLIDQSIGKSGRKYVWLVGTMFIFILCLNLSWFIPGMLPPTTDLSTTAAFGVTTIIIVQLISLRHLGLKRYIERFTKPILVLAPMNVIEELVKPFSLSVRLFGNMFGEKTVVTILFIMIPLIVPTPIMLLGVLMGSIQAFVFTLLTVTYVAVATHGH